MDEIEQLRRLRDGLPGPRPQAREAARAVLLEHVGPAPSQAPRLRWYGRRALALACVACAATVAILIAIGSAGGPSAKPELASAAELRQLAAVFPRLQIAGKWQIVSTEGNGERGRVLFRDEYKFRYLRPKVRVSPHVEILWRPISQKQRESELREEGFARAGAMQVEQSRPVAGWVLPFKFRPVDVTAYLTRSLDGRSFSAVALWHEGGRVFELHAGVGSLYKVWRLAERIEILGEGQWLIALKVGGGVYLAETGGGLAARVEHVKTGERPNGDPIYETKSYVGVPGKGNEFKPHEFTLHNLTTIYRNGDQVRVVVTPPPR